jgi:putative addiction module CopG family antidote
MNCAPRFAGAARCAARLGLTSDPAPVLSALAQELDQTYRAVAARLPNNSAVRFETVDGRKELVLSPFDKLEDRRFPAAAPPGAQRPDGKEVALRVRPADGGVRDLPAWATVPVLQKVESGRYENASEVVRAALRTLERKEQRYEAKLAALRTSIDEGDASGIAEGNVFERVREQLNLPSTPR